MKNINTLRKLDPKIRRELVANVIARNCLLRYEEEKGLIKLLSDYECRDGAFINKALIWSATEQGDDYWRSIWIKLCSQ